MKRSLIVLMGLDGSGKSTQAQLLANWLREQGTSADVVWMRGESYVTLPLLRIAKLCLRAPKGKKRGDAGALRPRSAGGADLKNAYAKYVASKRALFRYAFVRAIWRRLVLLDLFITFRMAFAKLGGDVKVIILDRYVYDSLIDIDSSFAAGGAELRRLLKSWSVRVFPQPDMVVLFELSPAEAMRRKDDIPSMEYLEERHDLYKVAAVEVKAAVIDASRPIDAIRNDLIRVVSARGLAGSAGPARPAGKRPGANPSAGCGQRETPK
jgi:thymidylate kinase